MGGKNGLRPKLPRLMPVRYREDFAAVMDGRSRLAREVRDRLSALVADLGGEDALSHAQRSLCQRAVWLELCIEHEETRIAEGGGSRHCAAHTASRRPACEFTGARAKAPG